MERREEEGLHTQNLGPRASEALWHPHLKAVLKSFSQLYYKLCKGSPQNSASFEPTAQWDGERDMTTGRG